MLFRCTTLKRADAIAEEQGSTNGWQRIIYGLWNTTCLLVPTTHKRLPGYGSQKPAPLPRTRQGLHPSGYERVDTYPPEPKSGEHDESFVLFDSSKDDGR